MAAFLAKTTRQEVMEPQDVLDDSWLECSICLEALTTNHRVLPCQHTFCLPCLQDLSSSAKKKNQKLTELTEIENKGFLCPECRTLVETSLDKLPSNVILNRILEGRKKSLATKPDPVIKESSTPVDAKNTPENKRTHLKQTEKILNSTQCDKYKAFAEAARALNEPKITKPLIFPKENNASKGAISGDKMSKSSCDMMTMMQSDIKPPNVPPPPIPGNLSTNPFMQMVASEIIPTSTTTKPKLEKENTKSDFNMTRSMIEKDKPNVLSMHNQNNQSKTAPQQMLGQNSPAKQSLKANPTLPPRSLSIASPASNSMITSAKFTQVQGSPRIQSGTSSISTSGAEDGSSPESPAPSLPPKPSFSYSNVQTPQILGIRSTNIPPPVQAPPPLPMHQKKSLQQQIEKELSAERKLDIPPSRKTNGGMPHQVYRALYDYTPNRSDELELHKNELYFVFEKCQDGWFKGSGLSTLKTGVFPGNYVQNVKVDTNLESQISSSKEQAKSLRNKEGSDRNTAPANSTSHSTTSSTNDLIDFSMDELDISSSNPENTRQRSDIEGSKSGQKNANASNLYRAVLDYPASSQYELELKEGDIVVLIKKREDGWCKGLLHKNGTTGLFPFSFVEKIRS